MKLTIRARVKDLNLEIEEIRKRIGKSPDMVALMNNITIKNEYIQDLAILEFIDRIKDMLKDIPSNEKDRSACYFMINKFLEQAEYFISKTYKRH